MCCVLQAVEDEEMKAYLLKEVKKQEVRIYILRSVIQATTSTPKSSPTRDLSNIGVLMSGRILNF